MLDGLYIIQRESGRLLFEKQFEDISVDTDLFSSLLSAIRTFTAAIHMGELTSFTTHNKKILVSLTEAVIVALAMDVKASTEKWQGTAYEIGHEFDEFYDLKGWNGDRRPFSTFEENISVILKTHEDPFVVRVGKWANKEFGGDLHIDQQLVSSSGREFLVNVIIDRGELKDLGFRGKILTKFYKGYNRDLIFIFIKDNIAGLHDIEQFIESCQDLGYECHQKERCDHYFDYFPSKIIFVAKDFSPTAIEKIQEITRFDKKQEKHFIVSEHLGRHMKKKAMKIFQSYVELWEWDDLYPERIFS